MQSIESTYGFRYATATEARNLINNNFGNPPTVHPGTTSGYIAGDQFFSLFGIAKNPGCFDTNNQPIACPRTQGLTSTNNSDGDHAGFGMITFGSTGYAIFDNNWSDSFGGDPQMGSFLVRSTVSATPEPGSALLLGLGIAAVAAGRYRKQLPNATKAK